MITNLFFDNFVLLKWHISPGKKKEIKINVLLFLFTAMCGSPPPVAHTRSTAPLDKEDFQIDSVVMYNCFPGYDPKGFNKAMCLQYNGTAQWFGPDLTCIRKSHAKFHIFQDS